MGSERLKLNSVVFLLVGQDGKMLLQQRSMDTPVMPGYWAFFGGGIDEGETPLQAVVREAKEEIGLVMKDPHFVFEQDFTLDNADGHMCIFIEVFNGDKEDLSLNEGSDWGWFTLEEMQSLKMIPHDKVAIKKVYDYIKDKDLLCQKKY